MKWVLAPCFICLKVCDASPLVQSVGVYWNGKLQNGVNGHAIYLKHPQTVEPLSPAFFQYGNTVIIDSVLQIGAWLRTQFDGKYRLQVGDQSKSEGGKLARHETHQNGLDADIAYLSTQPKESGHRSKAKHNRFREKFVKDGKLTAGFDLPKNYTLLRYIVKTQDVSQIFLGCKVKEALLGFYPPDESPEERTLLFSKLIAYPHHDDHFHLRLKCPIDNPECKNDPRKWKDVGCNLSPKATY